MLALLKALFFCIYNLQCWHWYWRLALFFEPAMLKLLLFIANVGLCGAVPSACASGLVPGS
jgi:hypothetical protein